MATPAVRPIDLEALTLDAFKGQPVAVLGLARSGLALTRFLCDRGAVVTAYDGREPTELADALTQLEGRSPRLLLGPSVDPRAALEGQALITTSPSINSRYPTTEPRLRAALAATEADGRVPVVSEVDLFLRLFPGTSIGVTGTKGKTTTSSLIAAILARGDAPTLLGGNIGVPLVERLPELTSQHRVVLELSELQLPTLSRGTDVAVYTHVTSDHLDRHGTLEAYRAVKRRLAGLLGPGGTLIRNDDDPVVSGYAAPDGATVIGYSLAGLPRPGVGVVDGWLVARAVGPGGSRDVGAEDLPVMAADEIPLPGRHNVANALAAVAVGLSFGIAPEAIRAAVRGFEGVEHRLELVSVIDGVRYVNDSQGTQPDAVIAAVRSFAKPLILIAGGRSKGIPVAALAAAVAERVSAAVLIGETAGELEGAFRSAGLAHIRRAGSMDDAVTEAAELAAGELGAADPASAEMATGGATEPRATVLLSPAAASFDMFRDYEARGQAFKAAVRALEGRGAEAGR